MRYNNLLITITLALTPIPIGSSPEPYTLQSPEYLEKEQDALIMLQKLLRLSTVTTTLIFCLSTLGFLVSLQPRYGVTALISLYPWYLSRAGLSIIARKTAHATQQNSTYEHRN